MTFVNGGECPPIRSKSLPTNAACITAVDGDADGDGAEDSLMVYARVGQDLIPRSWHLRMESAAGAFHQRLRAGNKFSYPRAIGAADIDDDGRDEWFIKAFDLAGHGTAWQVLNMFILRGDRLDVVTYEGEPLALPVGGVSRLGEGVKCRGGDVVLLRAEAQNRRNTHWNYSKRVFTLQGSEARYIRRTTGRLTISDYADPARERFYSFDCAGLHYPS